MGFLDYLRERQRSIMQHRHELAVQAREQWLGCRVTVYAPQLAMRMIAEGAFVYLGDESGDWVQGEVVEINDYGDVRVAYGVGQRGEVYYKSLRLEDLGQTCVAVES